MKKIVFFITLWSASFISRGLVAEHQNQYGVAFRSGTGLARANGLELFYNLNKRISFELIYQAGSAENKPYAQVFMSDSYVPTKAMYTTTNVSLQTRYFVSSEGTFNTTFGLGQKNNEIDIEASWLGGFNTYSLKINAEITYYSLGLGNLWTWEDGLYIGVDWFNFYSTIGDASPKVSEEKGFDNATERNDLEQFKLINTSMATSAIMWTNIFIGYSF